MQDDEQYEVSTSKLVLMVVETKAMIEAYVNINLPEEKKQDFDREFKKVRARLVQSILSEPLNPK